LNPNGWGTAFRVTPEGTFNTLVFFNQTNGFAPQGGLTPGNDGNLYGTAAGGGRNDVGIVFRLTTNGILTTFYSFAGPHAEPHGGLTLGSDGNYYGTTYYGGMINAQNPNGFGTVYKLTPDGAFTNLAVFNGTNGANPEATLTHGADGNLYGTTFEGGDSSLGTIFKVTTSGTLTSLFSFGGTNGGNPRAELLLGDDGNLYGTSAYGATGGVGTVFRIETNGAVTMLVSLSSSSFQPWGGLTLGGDGRLYGTSYVGGVTNSTYTLGRGTVCTLSGPPVTIMPRSDVQTAGSNIACYAVLSGFGPPPFSFQWFLNGAPIGGATTSTLTLASFSVNNAGRYSVVVSNNSGSATASRIFRLRNSPVVLVDGIDVGGGPAVRIAAAQISMFSAFGSSAHIYYTLDGGTPSYLSSAYEGPFQISKDTIIRAVAYDPAYLSAVEAAPITIVLAPVYRLDASTGGGGTIAVSPPPYSGADRWISNTLLTLTTMPSSGWSFLGWLGDATGQGPTAQLTINHDLAVQGIFGTTVVSNVLGAGTLSLGPGPAPYPFGTSLQVSAVPNAGNYLAGWAGTVAGSNNPSVLVVTNPNPVITALFGPLGGGQCALTVLRQGEGNITIRPYTNRYTVGTTVSLTAAPAPGQTFVGWSGGTNSLLNPLSFTLTQSEVLTGSFSSVPTMSAAPPLNRMTDKGFLFSVLGELGSVDEIFGSPDLVNWTSFGLFTNTLGTLQILDIGGVSNTAHFYRAATRNPP
jgi:uncharacterized repeat protein (TIGR03803 family)